MRSCRVSDRKTVLAAAFAAVLLLTATVNAGQAQDFRALLDDKVAMRTSLGLRTAQSLDDNTIEVTMGLSATGICRVPEAYRLVSFEDPRYAFEKFIRPTAASARVEREADAPPGCPFDGFSRTIVTLKVPFPLLAGVEYHVLARGRGSEPITGAHSAQSFVHGAPPPKRDPGLDLAALGLRRIRVAGPRYVEAQFGPDFAPEAGTEGANYTLKINNEVVTPARVGRFTRVFAYLPVGWPYVAIPEHHVYFELPNPLRDGDVIELEANGSVTRAAASASMTFQSRRSYTDSIKVNQVGYLTDSPVKWAYMGKWMGSLGAMKFDEPPQEFSVCESDSGKVAWSGRPKLRHKAGDFNEGTANHNDMSGEDVYVLDFTELSRPGRYFISVPGVGRSFDFRIADDAYDQAFQVAAHGVFIQRCGIALGPPYSDWRRIACHKKGIQPTTMVKGKGPSEWVDPKLVDPNRPTIMAYGGHHDAGDYNPRSHIDVAQALMDAYEMAPQKFFDGQLNIPEQDNGIPDVLDESAWAFQLWQMLQDKDGGVPHGTESNGDPNFIQTAEMDVLGDYAFAKDAVASFTFAGVMAQASRIWSGIGQAEKAAEFLAQGQKAYQWAMARDRSEQASKDAWAYAAAQMLRTTGQARYGEDFKKACVWSENPNAPLDQYNKYNQAAAAWAYVNCGDAQVDPELHAAVRKAILGTADGLVRNARTLAYAFIKHPWAPINWGTGAYENFLTPVTWAYYLTGDETYLKWMIHTCDNTLGANPLNLSWIVDLGTNTIRAPLHNSRYGHSGEVAPGIECEGPSQNADGYRVKETFFPPWEGRKKFPPLYTFVDAHFAIVMDEGVVSAQAKTMATFGLLLPDHEEAKTAGK
ncbi:MAG: glycoside hydrolase family 9 protein [Planctomycetes bacterium]|nr:glycoside hydrolase family 9 protein [Planctomycetota bacterium]